MIFIERNLIDLRLPDNGTTISVGDVEFDNFYVDDTFKSTTLHISIQFVSFQIVVQFPLLISIDDTVDELFCIYRSDLPCADKVTIQAIGNCSQTVDLDNIGLYRVLVHDKSFVAQEQRKTRQSVDVRIELLERYHKSTDQQVTTTPTIATQTSSFINPVTTQIGSDLTEIINMSVIYEPSYFSLCIIIISFFR